ncbi:MAG: riboflavin biosynthesis protein RibF [Prevotellaceae bacterium]|jgi:riboflavin kinase/FMN adenylyltransferase|nr:riboflavin biosynthesis protein RibF [Prevotellaceae bacterium]
MKQPSDLYRPCTATIGFFDGVHRGHRYLIEQVMEAALQRRLDAAVITFPIHPRQVLQPTFRPELLTTYEEKLSLLTSLGIDRCITIDFTASTAALTARAFMQLLHDNYNVQALLIGYDHRFGHNRSEDFDDYVRYGKELDIEVVRAQAYTGGNAPTPVSSSAIRALLHKGDVSAAARCLDYNYLLEGTVVGGYHVGRTIGYPTANLRVNNPDKVIPADGVYAVHITVEGTTYQGMLYIGRRPTLHNGPERSIEVNIFGFHQDIYNCHIRIEFVSYVRGDQTFSGMDELTAQLHKDEAEVRRLLN